MVKDRYWFSLAFEQIVLLIAGEKGSWGLLFCGKSTQKSNSHIYNVPKDKTGMIFGNSSCYAWSNSFFVLIYWM